MSTVERFEDLRIWQKARELSQWLYSVVQTSPLRDDYRLRNQIEGSIGSVMDNIAEGFERNGKKEFSHFLSISKGSAGEFRSQLYRLADREYITTEILDQKLLEVMELSRGISSFMNYLSTTEFSGWKFKEEEVLYQIQAEANDSRKSK